MAAAAADAPTRRKAPAARSVAHSMAQGRVGAAARACVHPRMRWRRSSGGAKRPASSVCGVTLQLSQRQEHKDIKGDTSAITARDHQHDDALSGMYGDPPA